MIPSKSEVMGWTPEKLADFLRKSRLQGCDRVVLQHRINGERFMNLSENDLLKFPTTATPMISKLRADIRKQKGKHSFFGFGQSKPQQPVETAADPGGWGDDEFDDDFDGEFDDDYEEPGSDNGGESDNYEDPDDDPDPRQNPMDQIQAPDPDEDLEADYEPPPSEPSEDFTHKLPQVSLGNSDYIDSHVSSRGPPPALCPRPPVSAPHRTPTESRRDASPRPLGVSRPSAKIPPQMPPQICRASKPGRDPGSNHSPNRGAHRNTVEKPLPPSWSRSQPDPPDTRSKPLLPPTPTSVSRSNSGARPPPHRFESRREPQPVPDEPVKRNTFPLHNKSAGPGLPPIRHTDSLPPGVPSLPHKPSSGPPQVAERPSFRTPAPAVSSNQDLDPVWYVGTVTRREAEATLRRLGKDGSYLVRDSTRQSSVQPYTLMVLFQHKVYNIQIQIQEQKYLLGTGLKVQESFVTVREIVEHFSQSPLLLIDAKNRSSDRQNQCVLSEPAGPYMERV